MKKFELSEQQLFAIICSNIQQYCEQKMEIKLDYDKLMEIADFVGDHLDNFIRISIAMEEMRNEKSSILNEIETELVNYLEKLKKENKS